MTVIITWAHGFTETTLLEASGPGLEFEERGPEEPITSIKGYVASGSQAVIRAVTKPAQATLSEIQAG